VAPQRWAYDQILQMLQRILAQNQLQPPTQPNQPLPQPAQPAQDLYRMPRMPVGQENMPRQMQQIYTEGAPKVMGAINQLYGTGGGKNPLSTTVPSLPVDATKQQQATATPPQPTFQPPASPPPIDYGAWQPFQSGNQSGNPVQAGGMGRFGQGLYPPPRGRGRGLGLMSLYSGRN